MLRGVYQYIPELVRLPRPVRRLMVFGADLFICAFSVWFSFWLRLGEWDWLNRPTFILMGLTIGTWSLLAVAGGAYRSVIRFSGRHTVYNLIPLFGAMSFILAVVLFGIRITGVPRTLSIIQPMVFFFGAVSLRMFGSSLIWKAIDRRVTYSNRKRILVYGAGSAAQQLAQSMRFEPSIELVGFVDDNPALAQRLLEGKTIWHADQLEQLVASEDVTDVYLAIPSAPRSKKRQVIERIQKLDTTVAVRTLPTLSQIAFGHVTTSDLKEVQIEELLGRDEVAPDPLLLSRDINGMTVLVTGAGGSIGSELSRQIVRLDPKRLILADRSEFALYNIDSELQELKKREGLRFEIVPYLVDVANQDECAQLFEHWRPDTVFHAAAYKHVPLVEANPFAGIRNNIFGTLYCASQAERVGSWKFVLISTDKAVRPTNIMGSTKRICELIVQARAAEQRGTTFVAVRFGNVLGSSGSVVPKFRQQIAAGGPITITHREVTRYFMTIPEAAQLVIQAGAMGRGGEVYLLDMGEPVKIADLARAMIELSGLAVRDVSNPHGDIEIVEIGMRPGEKLFEELLISADSRPTNHPRIVCGQEDFFPWTDLGDALSLLRGGLDRRDQEAVLDILLALVPGYQGSLRNVSGFRVGATAVSSNREVA